MSILRRDAWECPWAVESGWHRSVCHLTDATSEQGAQKRSRRGILGYAADGLRGAPGRQDGLRAKSGRRSYRRPGISGELYGGDGRVRAGRWQADEGSCIRDARFSLCAAANVCLPWPIPALTSADRFRKAKLEGDSHCVSIPLLEVCFGRWPRYQRTSRSQAAVSRGARSRWTDRSAASIRLRIRVLYSSVG